MTSKIIIFWFYLLVRAHALQPIHLSIVVCGDRLEEALNALKSSLIFTPPPLIFHIFTEDHLRHLFTDKIESEWPLEYRLKFQIQFYPIEYPRGNDQRWRSLFKPCCTQRLFFPELLQSIDALIYIDTDVLFLSNVRNLWRLFRKFNSTQLAALSPEHEEPAMGWYNRFARHPYYGQMGLNSGVMLMNLTRMRAVSMISEIVEIFDKYHQNITWGDQCLLNIYFHFHPERIYTFNCQLNYRPDHCIYENNCHSAAQVGVHILHGCRSAFHNDKYPEFKAIYQIIDRWKFDVNFKTSLLTPIQTRLQDFSSTSCGKSRDLFTKQLSREISTRQHSTKEHYHWAFLIRDEWNFIDQVSILIQSLLLFSSNPTDRLHLHVVVTDDRARHYFSQQVERWIHRITYYNTSIEHPFQLSTLLSVDRVVYTNPNVIMVNSWEKLWSSFDEFNGKQVIGLFSQCHLSGYSHLLFMHLSRMRELKIKYSSISSLSTENVFFLPCKFLLEPRDCRSIDDAIFLPEQADPELFGKLYQTISQIHASSANIRSTMITEPSMNTIETSDFRNQLIEMIKNNVK